MRAIQKISRGVLVTSVAVSAAVATVTWSLNAQTIAITGGTVYPVSGPKIERGTVIVRDGRIASVGQRLLTPIAKQMINQFFKCMEKKV